MTSLPDVAQEYEALLQFLYLAPVGLVQTAPDGEIALINPISAQLLMPLSRDGNLSNLFTALEGVAPDLRQQAGAFDSDHGMICDGMRLPISAGVRGQSDPRVLSLSLLKLDQTRLMAVLSDVSLQVKREKLLRQNEAWLNAVLKGITDYALVNLDADGCVVEWNPSIGRVTCLATESVVGKPFSVFYPNDATTPERMSDRLQEANQSGWSLEDSWHLKADGSLFWGSSMIAPLRSMDEAARSEFAIDASPEDTAYCLVIRDISDRRDASEIQRLATSADFLTGLANRRAFFEAAELEVERYKRSPRPLSIIMFDADHFKAINDAHGHPGGDDVLKHFAAILGKAVRPIDIVARVGGEEFVVMLPSTDVKEATVVAERIRMAVQSQPAEVDGKCVRYTVSAGVAAMDADAPGLDALIKRADLALYQAKSSGRNCVAVDAPSAERAALS